MTRAGALLRRTSLDELPNLFNVVRGEMAIVGPRPTISEQVEEYTPEQRRRLEVKPGLTGWAQVNGRASLPWEERIELDVWYVDNRSPRLDLRILGRTVALLVTGSWALRGMSARLLSTADVDAWNEALPPERSAFGSLGFARAQERSGVAQHRLLVAEQGDGRVAYPLQLRPLADLPFHADLASGVWDSASPPFTGPLAAGDLGEATRPVADAIAGLLARRGRRCRVRPPPPVERTAGAVGRRRARPRDRLGRHDAGRRLAVAGVVLEGVSQEREPRRARGRQRPRGSRRGGHRRVPPHLHPDHGAKRGARVLLPR